jgi:hypothetical protein
VLDQKLTFAIYEIQNGQTGGYPRNQDLDQDGEPKAFAVLKKT